MHHVATFNFRDRGNDDDASVIVRADEGQVGLCVSLKSDGDVEVFLPVHVTNLLIEALNRAVDAAGDAKT